MAENYKQAVDKVLSGLKQYEGFFSNDYYISFYDRVSKMKQRIDDALVEGRLLKIGIVGEIKAGKSSFLNALFFDGDDVLPKADTPMTAALTKITYSEQQSAEIVFYTEKEWEIVKDFSQQYDQEFEKLYSEYVEIQQRSNMQSMSSGYAVTPLNTREEMRVSINQRISDRLIAFKELTDLAEKTGIDITDYLGKKQTLLDNNIKEGLNNYIGVNGEYTAIVKYVNLSINNEMLKGIEIVDTPGLDDPILSRSELTKQFLGECDIVFLLSPCSQFLTQKDISFMYRTLPSEGIRNVILVGSKIDSGMLDDNESKSVFASYKKSTENYNKTARDNISNCIRSGNNSDTMNRLQNSLPPSYVSAMLFSCAVKKKLNKPYTSEEAHIIKRLKEQFPDFDESIQKTLLPLSGIMTIKNNKLPEIKDKKKEIIAEKNRKIIEDQKKILLDILEDINTEVIKNKNDLEIYSKEQIEKKLHTIKSKLSTVRTRIRDIFDECSVDAGKFMADMKIRVDQEISNYVDFETKSETHIESHSRRTGFLGLKTEWWDETVTTYYASVSDVIANMRKYITRCIEFTNDEFGKLINIRKLNDRIKVTALDAFDLTSDDFNENDILIPLNIVIKKIQIPRINIERDKFTDMLINSFSSLKVTGDEIHNLNQQAERVFGKIAAAIKEELDRCLNEVETVMKVQSVSFVDSIEKQLEGTVNILSRQIDDKENSIRKYNALKKSMVEYKTIISEMEF